jgi:hypothetical protein
MQSPATHAAALLATTTSEPYQPVRLYYSIPSRAFVLGRIGKLRCMQPSGRGLDWYCRDEVDSLEIGYKRIRPPPEAGDVLLAQVRFPKTGMTISFGRSRELSPARSTSSRRPRRGCLR